MKRTYAVPVAVAAALCACATASPSLVGFTMSGSEATNYLTALDPTTGDYTKLHEYSSE